VWVPVIRFMSCGLPILMDQPTESISSHDPPRRHGASCFDEPSEGARPTARYGRWPLSWSLSSASTDTSPRHPKINLRSSTSRRTLPPTAPHRHWPAAPAPACAAPSIPSNNDRVEGGGEPGIPVAEQNPEATDTVAEGHDQVAGLPGHPVVRGRRCHPSP
jgi:hypothetical protein